MKVAVVGAGGVGGFLGALLANSGHEVHFLARGAHLAAIRERGLQVRSRQFGDFTVKSPASDDPTALGPAELVIVAVKMYDFESILAPTKQLLVEDGMALTIQNGLDAPYDLARVVGDKRVLIGTTAVEAAVLEPGVIGHMVPFHQLTLSELEGPPTPRLNALTEELKAARINGMIEANGYHALWNKAAPLIPFATLTAAANCGLGTLVGVPAAHSLFQRLLEEASAVARSCGYDPSESVKRYLSQLDNLARQAPTFTSSMNRDLVAGKPVELEWLTGKLCRLAAEHHVDAAAHQALYAVLKIRAEARAP